jgi:predicted DNA-binding protein YlxM (UPF0122 family)
MTNTTYLTEQQINGLLTVIRTDYINPQVIAKYKEIQESDEYKAISDRIKSSDEFLKEIEEEENQYKKNIEIFNLYEKLKELGEVYSDNWDSSWLASTTLESIDTVHKSNISSINNIDTKVLREMKIETYDWDVEHAIEQDIIAVLRLTTATNYDETIKEAIKHINVDKRIKA